MKRLNLIQNPLDLRRLSPSDLPELCLELREFLIREILSSGGHFSANLGTVELTVGLHYVFKTPEVPLIWDVGHQAYAHKVLTGRRDQLFSIRKLNGLSGFPRRDESIYDVFGTGHSSTSLSAALGLAEAYRLKEDRTPVVAVIGDGSLTAGMAWEALNNAGSSHANIRIVINDNQIGIDPNSGALHHYLGSLTHTPDTIFSSLGFAYYGPVDGHNIADLLQALETLKVEDGPAILHVKTLKGKGFPAAEKEQTKWHAVKYVKVEENRTLREDKGGAKFQEVFGTQLLELARREKHLVGVTPAMPSGCSMDLMMEQFPDRVFDVGIAEQHAVTFSAGMVLGGYRVFCNIYSTFFQRAYDQMIHDVCLQNIPVVFFLDRSGVVGEDGPTHHGLYDLAYLRPLPNLTIAAPSSAGQLRNLMNLALDFSSGPLLIRYPKGRVAALPENVEQASLIPGKACRVQSGKNVAVLNLGALLHEVLLAVSEMAGEIEVWDMIWLKPLDHDLLDQLFSQFETLIVVEDGIVHGGFFGAVSEYAAVQQFPGKIVPIAFPDEIIPHASREELLEIYGLNAAGIASALRYLKG